MRALWPEAIGCRCRRSISINRFFRSFPRRNTREECVMDGFGKDEIFFLPWLVGLGSLCGCLLREPHWRSRAGFPGRRGLRPGALAQGGL